MAVTYRRPGVYLEESLLVQPSADIASTITAACFIGVAGKGPGNVPILVESWPDYVRVFGSYDLISQPLPPVTPTDQSTRLLGPGGTGGAAGYANLAALKSDATEGDGHYAGTAFAAGEYVVLGDTSHAYCKGTGVSALWLSGDTPQTPPPQVLSYLPYAVWSFFQNGGRFAWIIRAVPTTGNAGTAASVIVNQGVAETGITPSFTIKALSPGKWGNELAYELIRQATETTPDGPVDVFTLRVYLKNSAGDYERVESFGSLTTNGAIASTRRVDIAVNDPNNNAGSTYIQVADLNPAVTQPNITPDRTPLLGGVDPGVPVATDLEAAAAYIGQVEGPINLNIVGYLNDATKANSDDVEEAWVGASLDPQIEFEDREDIFSVNDNCPPRGPGGKVTEYISTLTNADNLGAHTGSSYVGAYTPWVLIPNPTAGGSTIAVPAGGAVMGTMARIDATIGVFRAPAGTVSSLTNVVGVQTKFTDAELGDLNSLNFNAIRSVVGAGICIMGARTRRSFGIDHYVSARRTLISIKEALRRNTQWAVFENNDEMLWSSLVGTADRILRPLWEEGGLRGSTAEEAYYILCDETINTATVIQSGEVRMEVGVALQYPAEFVIIKITQFDRGTFTAEVQPPL
jgi:uncharacterized protein